MQLPLKGEVSIEQVLSEMRATPERVFWLAFVRATGKERGTVKVVSKCQYGPPAEFRRTVDGGRQEVEGDKERNKSLHVDRGTLPLTDYDRGDYITPLISHLIGYNMKKIIH